jgi:hypothetical protein
MASICAAARVNGQVRADRAVAGRPERSAIEDGVYGGVDQFVGCVIRLRGVDSRERPAFLRFTTEDPVPHRIDADNREHQGAARTECFTGTVRGQS